MFFSDGLRPVSVFAAFCFAVPAAVAGDDAEIRDAGGRVRDLGGGLTVEFHLTAPDLDDASLECVAGRGDIVSLNLRDTQISDDGLRHLSSLRGLRRLHLERTGVGDAGLKHLAGLGKLEYLNLYETKITDAGLESLAALKGLRKLFVWQTGVTDEGCRRLEKALPGLTITGGVDLEQIAAEAAKKAAQPAEPRVDLKWHPAGSGEPPVSNTGTFTTVLIENKRPHPVKLYWVEYGQGGLRFYADIAAGATLNRNTFSEATWVITDESEIPLGYFISVVKPSRVVIPAE